MSFYTSLTGLNAATAMLGVTSNNIANVGTTGFKRSRADFGDIFATSPLQKASSTVGQGVSLKQVSQEFGQGNISFSANALDLAVTGDGFFPMRSADGLQDIFTRNGSFMLNEQFNVVNSAGERLMASTVDSTGSANVNERVVLTIPQKTSGEAKQTSQVQLGLNFPADASVITEAFSRTNPATYNKSTAFTVYDAGGNGYLATIYYVKSQNANQASPYNKWQTHVFIGSDEVTSSLQQATDKNGALEYVNQYGVIQPYSAVKDQLTTAKTQMFSLNQLTDTRTSVPASVSGVAVPATAYDWANGVNFSTLSANDKTNLFSMFKIDVDNSKDPVTVDLSYLASSSTPLTGSEVAAEVTNLLNKKFGDENYFDLSNPANCKFVLTDSGVTTTTGSGSSATTTPTPIDISLTASPTNGLPTDMSKVTIAQMQSAIQLQLDAFNKNNSTKLTVRYDYAAQGFKFVDNANTSNTITIAGGSSKNDLFGLTTTSVKLDDYGGYAAKVTPNTTIPVRLASEQRTGMSMVYDSVNGVFKLQSGTTGDTASIAVTGIDPATNPLATSMFGLSNQTVSPSSVALRGVVSTPAVAYGTTPTVNVNNNFAVDATNNTFVVTVDGVKGTVTIPIRADYSLATFETELQNGINALASNNGTGTPTTVNGVKVAYDATNSRFTFTTGTASSNSFITVSGSGTWGLDQTTAGRGTTSTWIKPTQHVDIVSGSPQAKYIDSNGKETTSSDGFTTLPEWSPIYLDKGELTFDTGGKLVSPLAGTQLDTVFLAGGKGALTINVNYSASTQYTSPFAVLSQSQDGAPEGDLVGVTIGNDGLVSASFSNGTQQSLAKILLTNFSSPTGLRQIGDSSFLASAASGSPILGTAGSAGFGTLRAGATERANVDLTQELVDLITAQRNFQANAKAIETSTTMTSAIINMRAG
ncbi:MAG: flagellar hook-basal body complex protein [Comamonadaceae bacterium]